MKQTFYDEYYKELKTAFENGNPSIRYNSDRAHNAVIMCFMFDHSNVVNMFCGQMSVLRTGFFHKINENNEYNDDQLGDELRGHLQNSLVRFLAKDGTLFNILFESYNEAYSQDLVCVDAMKRAFVEGKLDMKVLADDLKIRNQLDHFTVSDAGMYRFEDDKEQHSAICSFNDRESTSQLQRNFQKLYSLEDNKAVRLA